MERSNYFDSYSTRIKNWLGGHDSTQTRKPWPTPGLRQQRLAPSPIQQRAWIECRSRRRNGTRRMWEERIPDSLPVLAVDEQDRMMEDPRPTQLLVILTADRSLEQWLYIMYNRPWHLDKITTAEMNKNTHVENRTKEILT